MSSKASGRIKSLRAVLLAAGMALGLGAGAQMPDGRPTPSGFDVPRWVSIKSSPARARRGPGLDHRILWEYRAAGLPVQVVAETRDWRKICDPEGNVAWVHRTITSGRRTVFNRTEAPLDLRRRPDADARVRARLAARAVITLDRCEDGWCRLQSGRLRGWAPQEALFGVQTQAQCAASSPAGRAAGR
ncbi:SH3 domain-containing protein [Brevundimonas sp.]|uniref:SH3 domain-containing protein n=1 Tax=Brevundimonas sp. TaxID=1871086 RepID=UPI00391A9498